MLAQILHLVNWYSLYTAMLSQSSPNAQSSVLLPKEVVHIKNSVQTKTAQVRVYSRFHIGSKRNQLVRFHQKLFDWDSSRMLQGGCLSQRLRL